MEQDIDQRLQALQREFFEFLDDEEDQGKYSELVKNMLADEKRRLIINLNDLRRKKPKLAHSLLNNAFEHQQVFQKALNEYVIQISTEKVKNKDEYLIGFEGSFGNKHVTPRTLTSRFLTNLICVEGIVTKCSLVHPKVVRSVHYCQATKKILERKYTDLTSLEAIPSAAVYPTKDEDGNPLETEYGLSTYKDHQTITIQEMPEKAPAGQLPRSVDIICDDDLVDCCKPGDRIQVVGNFRCLPNKQGNLTNGTFRTVVIANNISQLSKEVTPSISRDDIAECKKLAKANKGNMFNILAKSLAPSIHGHETIKKAILCLLLGGVEKILPNGTRLRGDINILLIGDPSVAKSQLLRYVLATAPRAIPTTGRGSSGVGLTAAVTTDQETGERRLEAGAMVLADRGVVCIDEFDKMSDIDRTAIHEVMEQGRVTIAKAGIHASLNARCSVLAAANPVYGKYDQYKTPMENIGLQDSLLSRFDCLFVMLDSINEDNDLKISDHVVRMHRYRNPVEQDGEVLAINSSVDLLSTVNPDEDEHKKTQIYETYNPLLHGQSRSRTDKIFSVEFMRKYIHFVKILKPSLTEGASEIIADEYSKLRSEDILDNNTARTQPVTPRTLETMIRLSTAHAKARMSPTVDAEDADAAIALVRFAYLKEVLEKEKKRRRRADSSESDDEEQIPKKTRSYVPDSQMEVDSDTVATQSSVTNGHTNGDTTLREVEIIDDQDQEKTEITPERLSAFKSALQKEFKESRSDSLTVRRIRESVNSNNPLPFTMGEIHDALLRMDNDNQVMYRDGIVVLI